MIRTSRRLVRFTSPRLRGEVEIRHGEFRVRGTHRLSNSPRKPLTPTLSPQERGEGAPVVVRDQPSAIGRFT